MMNGAHDVVEVELRHHAETLKDHETRIRVMEKFQAKTAGWAMAGAAIGSVIVQFLIGIMK